MDLARKQAIWAHYEAYLAVYGKWVWWILILASIFYSIIALVISPYTLSNNIGFRVWWDFIFSGLSVVFSLKWVKPCFSTLCVSREWQSLVDDAFTFKNIRIPKLLLVNLLLVVFSIMEYGWGSLVILLPTLFIFAFAPIKVTFRATKPSEWRVADQHTPKPTEIKPVEMKVSEKPTAKVAGTRSVEMKVAKLPAEKPVGNPAPIAAIEKKEEIKGIPKMTTPKKKIASKPARNPTKNERKKTVKTSRA